MVRTKPHQVLFGIGIFYTHIFLKNFQYLDVFTKHIYASLTQNFEVWLPPKDSYQYQNVFSKNIIQYIMLESQMI